MRKREATAVEALERAESQPIAASASKKIGPVVDSGRIAAAKAEVLRLVELNKQRESLVIEESPAAAAETLPPVSDDIPEEIPVEISPEPPAEKKVPVSGELFAID